MPISLMEQQTAYLSAPQNSGIPGWLIFVGLLILIYGSIWLIGWILIRIDRRNADIDKKLMSVLNEEFPDYNFARLKSEIYYGYSKLNKCPRCGAILWRHDELLKPMQCMRPGCNYPER